MIAFSIAGLVLDLGGVLMLGYDLARVQRQLRREAQDRLSTLTEITDAAGGMDAFLKSISTDFRGYYFDEGRAVPDNTQPFDHESAERSMDELKGGVSSLADNLGTLAHMIMASAEGDRETASKSLWITYLGLLLILAGFGLQVAGYLPSRPALTSAVQNSHKLANSYPLPAAKPTAATK